MAHFLALDSVDLHLDALNVAQSRARSQARECMRLRSCASDRATLIAWCNFVTQWRVNLQIVAIKLI
jgi:hypothetical protein